MPSRCVPGPFMSPDMEFCLSRWYSILYSGDMKRPALAGTAFYRSVGAGSNWPHSWTKAPHQQPKTSSIREKVVLRNSHYSREMWKIRTKNGSTCPSSNSFINYNKYRYSVYSKHFVQVQWRTR
jgi:hypothetical protein